VCELGVPEHLLSIKTMPDAELRKLRLFFAVDLHDNQVRCDKTLPVLVCLCACVRIIIRQRWACS
jgi:hypothetical protein